MVNLKFTKDKRFTILLFIDINNNILNLMVKK